MPKSTYTPVLASLKADLDYYSDYLRGLAREILDAGASQYPVFVAWQGKKMPEIGKTILEAESLQRVWNINVCLLEELVAKNVIQKEKIKAFRSTFKDPELFMCVLVSLEAEAGFIFKPYDAEQEA